jgi:hypothetical protein
LITDWSRDFNVSFWPGVGVWRRRDGTGYDDIGRVEYVISYSNTAGSAVVNQVKHIYDAWGHVYREYEVREIGEKGAERLSGR